MTFSALTTDIEARPHLLDAMKLMAWANSPISEIEIREHHGVTTVTAVQA